MIEAKIFKSGGSQAVRLPKAFRFTSSEKISIYREGQRIILEPLEKSWSQPFLELVGSIPTLADPTD